MTRGQLAWRGLRHYWRTNLAVVLGVATAVAVLTGALLVGDSVRGSLRALVTDRLGRTDHAVLAATFFREDLAQRVAGTDAFRSRFSGVAPLLMAQGFVTAQGSGRRVGNVAVYGVDDRFWRFHQVSRLSGPDARDAFLSPALAAELGVSAEDAVLVRVQRPSDIPIESLHSRKTDLGRTMRVTVRRVIPASALGEFSLRPQQGSVRAVFVSLARVQRDLEIPGRANLLVASLAAAGSDADRATALDALRAAVRAEAGLDDLGLRVRSVGQGRLAVEAAAGVLDERQERAAVAAVDGLSLRAQPIFSYLANTIRVGAREVPYSLVAAVDLNGTDGRSGAADSGGAATAARQDERPPLTLTDWVARDVSARVGDEATIDYYVWEDPGRLVTKSQRFRVAAIVPLSTGDRDMSPEYPGITDSPTLDDWDPPFPVDLRRVRPQDDAFWRDHRTTPKAFVPLAVGQRLWRSRHGAVTSVRALPDPGVSGAPADLTTQLAARVREQLDPLTAALSVRDVRAEALAASRGATNFGEYFVYFSFFLVVSALVLTVLFFKLGIEQRVREVGLLRAVGFGPVDVRGVFLREGAALAGIGAVVGVAGALAYAWLVVAALRTWWVGAVGTTALSVHVGPPSLVGGAVGGVVAAVLCIWWTLRSLARVSERSLLAGELTSSTTLDVARPTRVLVALAVGLAVVAAGLLVGGARGTVGEAGAFFGAGTALLISALLAAAVLVRRPGSGLRAGRGSMAALGLRNVSYRPNRAVLSMAVVAAAAFVLVTVGAFRRGTATASAEAKSGVGGYSVMVETLVPIVHDLSREEGRRELGLTLPEGVTLEPFRVLPGDDASCLNLYAPSRPRILGVRASFIAEARFTFQASLADTAEERANPWRLLERRFDDGAIPVVADANSLAYVLHTPVGGDIVIDDNGRPVRLRVVGALQDSVLQGELLMVESAFVSQFPAQQGYGLLMAVSPPAQAHEVTRALENALVDHGGDARLTTARLDEFHQVENTYLSTFQTLGGLGLLLGTVGVGAVLLRNVLERRRELALLGAVGYGPRQFFTMALAENLTLVGAGVLVGGACAWVAVTPALAQRGANLPVGLGGLWLLAAILGTGILSALLATRATTRLPLLESLRSE